MLPNVRGTLLEDYLEALRTSHEFTVSMEVYDLDDNFIQRYDDNNLPILDGQVDVDQTADIERSLQMTFARVPQMTVDPTAPGAALSGDRQVRVIYTVRVPRDDGSLTDVDVDLFYGPVTRVERDSETVQIEAQGKESFLLPPNRLLRGMIPQETVVRTVDTVDGEKVVTYVEENKLESYYVGHVIRMMAKRYGERMLRVPRTDAKIPEDSKVFDRASQDSGAWPLMRNIAGKRQLFYDAEGYLRMRTRRTQRPVYVFKDGDKGTVLTEPVIDWDLSTFRNTVELRAYRRKNDKEKENPAIRVTATLEPWHPLSAQNMSRNNQAREIVEFVDSDEVYSDESRAKSDAKDILDNLAHEALVAQFDCLPIPHLEAGDLLAIDIQGDRRHMFTAKQFSIPLTPAAMTMGYNKKIRYHRRHNR